MSKTPDSVRLSLLLFAQLEGERLYRVLQLRSAVFVVEQQCIYQDIDGLDRQAQHLLVEDAEGGLCAYARILPPGVVYVETAIGRILTAACWRGSGYGRWLIRQSVHCARQLYPDSPIRIGAQAHLQGLYHDCGFKTVGEPYDEDGILHIQMLLEEFSAETAENSI